MTSKTARRIDLTALAYGANDKFFAYSYADYHQPFFETLIRYAPREACVWSEGDRYRIDFIRPGREIVIYVAKNADRRIIHEFCYGNDGSCRIARSIEYPTPEEVRAVLARFDENPKRARALFLRIARRAFRDVLLACVLICLAWTTIALLQGNFEGAAIAACLGFTLCLNLRFGTIAGAAEEGEGKC